MYIFSSCLNAVSKCIYFCFQAEKEKIESFTFLIVRHDKTPAIIQTSSLNIIYKERERSPCKIFLKIAQNSEK